MTAKRQIKNVGLDITNISASKLPTKLDKVGFVIINTYEGTRISLGDGPMNDGYNMAKCLKRFGYQIYYILNQKKRFFMEKLAHFLKVTEGTLAVYYVGHGTSVVDLDGDEDDGYDEAMVFVDGNVVDDDLIESIIKNKNQKSKCVLLSDCCHSGSIWDIQSGNYGTRVLPPNIMSISAATDKQTSKQTVVGRLEQGIFTYNLNKILKNDPKLSAKQIKTSLAAVLRKYGQTVTIATTTESMLTEPAF